MSRTSSKVQQAKRGAAAPANGSHWQGGRIRRLKSGPLSSEQGQVRAPHFSHHSLKLGLMSRPHAAPNYMPLFFVPFQSLPCRSLWLRRGTLSMDHAAKSAASMSAAHAVRHPACRQCTCRSEPCFEWPAVGPGREAAFVVAAAASTAVHCHLVPHAITITGPRLDPRHLQQSQFSLVAAPSLAVSGRWGSGSSFGLPLRAGLGRRGQSPPGP